MLHQTGGDKPRVLNHEENLRIILENDSRISGQIKFDSFTRRTTIFNDIVTDTMLTKLQQWFQVTYGLTFTIDKVDRVVASVAEANQFHAVRDHLVSLRWDGVRRIDTWLTRYLGVTDTVLSRAYGRKWLLSAVWRALRPGCQVDAVLILRGPQGAGKSTAMRMLCGSRWFGDSPLAIGNDQKVGQKLSGRWIYELAELASFGRKTQEEVKHFITERYDTYRPPYGRKEMTIPRTVVFCGTTNSLAILNDETGSRRYWVVDMKKLDRGAFSVDAHQLWAEAYAEISSHYDVNRLVEMSEDDFEDKVRPSIDSSVQWWLDAGEEAKRIEAADDYKVEDPIVAAVNDVIRDMGAPDEEFSHKWLCDKVGGMSGPGSRTRHIMVANHLDSLGFERYRKRTGYYYRKTES